MYMKKMDIIQAMKVFSLVLNEMIFFQTRLVILLSTLFLTLNFNYW